MSSLHRIVREPLLHFLAAGAAIFAFTFFYRGGAAPATKSVVIDATLAEHLAGLHRAQFGVEPDTATRERLIANYARDEVLYREALARGLDRDDDVVRRRLVQKFEFVLASAAELTPPTTAEIQTYYDAHREEYSEPGRVSFEHRYFSTDRPGAAARATAALAAGPENDSGDPLPLADHYDAVTRVQARQMFGDSDLVAQLFIAEPGRWLGPVASGYGLHLFRILARTPETRQPLAEVEADIREQLLIETRDRSVDAAVRALVARYRIERRDR